MDSQLKENIELDMEERKGRNDDVESSPGVDKRSHSKQFEVFEKSNTGDFSEFEKSFENWTPENKFCTICFDQPPDCVFMPCGHGGKFLMKEI